MTFDQFLDVLIQAIENSNPDDVAAMILVLSGIATVIAAVAFIGYILTAIGFSKIFKKAGEKGWKAFIPFLNDYTRFKIAWNTKAFWIWLLTLSITNIAPVFGDGLIVSLINIVAGIVFIVCVVKLYLNFAKAFGKGAGTAVLLFFFPFIMSLVLGFGKAEYVGNLSSDIAE